MSAYDNLSEPLFHGTPHDFKPGDIIEPRHALMGRGAYATSSADTAGFYATDPVRLAPQPKPEELTDDGLPEKPIQGRLFGTVYKVEPVEDEAPESIGSEAYRSQKGFRVKGVHSHVIPDWKNSW